MAYDAGTAFLQVVPSFDGVVTAIAAQATEWGDVTGAAFKTSFEGQVRDLNIGVQPALNQTDVSQILSELDVVTADRTVQINPTIGAAASAGYLASLAALIGFTAAAGAGGGAGGGGGAGLLATLGWGGGIAGMAGFGSILSLMGLGMEHLIVTVLGLAASLAGALAGGAALAAGSLAILAVGMGSDMMVARSAMADTKTLATDLNNISQATAVYGANSFQAAAATAQLKYDMQSLGNTAGVLAELQLAKAINALNAFWDQATSGARVAFVGMVTPLLSIAYTYIPLIARAATRNFGLIAQGLQPVIAFLNGPATLVFTNLENIFASRLPTAMSAFNQGVELFVNTLNYLADQTGGGLMIWLNGLLTYLNSPAGFVRFEHLLSTLIGMFLDWWGLLKQVAITIYDLFKPSAGLGTSIVTTLTQMLKSLDAWITTTSGAAALRTIFVVHKTEVLELLGVLGTLISVGGQIFLVLIPPFVVLANTILRVTDAILHVPFVGTILAWAVVLAILVTRMKLVALWGALMTIPAKVMVAWEFLTLLPTRIGLVILSLQGMATALWATVTGWVAETVAARGGWAAMVGPIALVIAGILLVGLAIYEIVTHWQVVVVFFKALPGRILTALGDVGNFLFNVGKAIIQGLINGLESMIGNMVSTLWKVIHTIQQIPVIGKLIGSPSPYFTMVGQAIGQGLVDGMLQSQGAVTAAGRRMVSGLGTDLGLATNSAIMASVGVSGGINLGGMSNSSVLGALQRIESAVVATPAATGAAISTKVSATMVAAIQQQQRTALQIQRAGG